MALPQIVTEKQAVASPDSVDDEVGKVAATGDIKAEEPHSPTAPSSKEGDVERDDVIIITGSDAAAHLLPLRDDFDPVLTFRSIFLATILSGFQAVMSQIYTVSFASIPLLLTCAKHVSI